jgi:uncharacterized protein (TIGR03000 family)
MSLLLALPDTGFAQMFGRGGRGGFTYGSGGFGYGNYGGTWVSPTYGTYGYGGWGTPSYGGYGAPYQSWGGMYYTQPAFSPLYSSNTQPYGYPGVVTDGSVYGGVPAGYSGYQSFYPPAGAAQQQTNDPSRAYIRVRVPADAQVMFDGTPTKQTGTDRMFMTPSLAGNQNYTYDITAQWQENGKDRKQTKTVKLVPGQTVDVDFTSGQGQNNNPTSPQFDQTNPGTPRPGTPPAKSTTPPAKDTPPRGPID